MKKMETYSYTATFEPAEADGVFTVTFQDVPGAITEGAGMAEARANAADALGVILLTYLELDRPLPARKAKANGRDCIEIAPEPLQAAKIAVIETFRAADITRTELARRMGRDEKEARRVLDPATRTKIDTINQALAAMGKTLVIGLEAAA